MKSNNSSDSEDSIPISIYKSKDSNSYSSLCEHAWEQCEFCNQQFSTRLANIKHNTTHIIIPLIKLTLHQCEDCLFHFSSLEDLRSHLIAKNHISSQIPETVTHTPKLSTGGYTEILQSIVEKQVIVKCHDTLSEVLSPKVYTNTNITNNSPVRKPSLALTPNESNSKETEDKKEIPDSIIPIFEISSDSDSESSERENSSPKIEHGTLENIEPEKQSTPKKEEKDRSSPFTSRSSKELSSPSQMRDLSSPIEPIKSRIMFEDDYDDDDLFEAEEILPDKLYHPHKTKQNSFIFGSQMNGSFNDTKSCINTSFNDTKSYNNTSLNDTKSYNNTSLNDTKSYKNTSFNDTKSYKNTSFNDTKSYKNTSFNDTKTYYKGLTINSLVNVSQTCDSLLKPLNGTLDDRVNAEVECYTKSVHYEELIVPEICDCRYCGRCFGNRFELIKHETSHMRAKRTRPVLCSVCERFIAGNYRSLRKHMEKHSTNRRKLQMQRCRVCDFSFYNYRRHAQYYHEVSCRICKQIFDREEFDDHDCNQSYNYKCKTCKKRVNSNEEPHVCTEPDLQHVNTSKVLKMCEMCVAFAKNKHNVHYEVIGEHSEIGSRQQCDVCGNKHFEVCLVKRKVKCREVSDYKKKKPMSNQDRLKKMQKRLKMVNKMNKC